MGMMLEKRIERILRSERKWLELPRNAMAVLEEKLAKDLRSSKGNARGATVYLGGIRHRLAVEGTCRVMDGDSGGWHLIRRAFEYEWWSHRVAAGGLVCYASPFLAQLIIEDATDRSAWLASRMIADIGRDDGRPFMWDHLPFGRFVATLWCRANGEQPPDFRHTPATDLGLFQAVVDSWDDEPALSEALLALCDRHVKTALAEAGHDFEQAPYLLYPVEILFIRHMRALEGKSTPELDHPFMKTPLANPPPWDEIPAPEPYPLLEQLIARARREGFLPAEGEL